MSISSLLHETTAVQKASWFYLQRFKMLLVSPWNTHPDYHLRTWHIEHHSKNCCLRKLPSLLHHHKCLIGFHIT